MSVYQNRVRRQVKEARLEIVAELYKKGYSIRKIREEVMLRLDLQSLSTATVLADVKTLLQEWRETRISDVDLAIQLELERIDDTIRELWSQWEKSKTDYTKTSNKRKGSPVRAKDGEREVIKTFQTEESKIEVVRTGDVSYISEIRQQLAERRKLLGLYAPEKKDITGELSFANLLIESGALDSAE